MAYHWMEPCLPEELESEGGYDVVPEPGLTVCDSGAVYCPRNPAESVLYGVVAGQLETFLARQQQRDRLVPSFVESELRAFLDCGIPARGFLRVHCDDCGQDRIVPYSCKRRGFCSSCGGRRMADTAAHLVDRVFPEVPIRQWVLSLPFALRYRLAYDSSLVRDVLHIFVQVVFASLRRRARRQRGIRGGKCGAVTFVQRFGGALNLNIHFHTLVIDGVYAEDTEGCVRFQRLITPDDAEIARVTDRIVRRVVKLLKRRGLGPQADPDEADPLQRDQPLLFDLYGASVTGRIATGARAGRRVRTIGGGAGFEEAATPDGPRCACTSGFSVHANVCVHARDRRRLELLCRYAARPAVATERLSLLPDGRVMYELKHTWRDGTTHVVFEPLELLEKLAALVPPPRFNLVRYHGVLAPAAHWRPHVVPSDTAIEAPLRPGCDGCRRGQSRSARPRNYTWAQLMHRVFELDVLQCGSCGGRMRIIASIHSSQAIRKILDCLGLPSRPPPIAPADQDWDEPYCS
jgi:ribosomal protein S27E